MAQTFKETIPDGGNEHSEDVAAPPTLRSPQLGDSGGSPKTLVASPVPEALEALQDNNPKTEQHPAVTVGVPIPQMDAIVAAKRAKDAAQSQGHPADTVTGTIVATSPIQPVVDTSQINNSPNSGGVSAQMDVNPIPSNKPASRQTPIPPLKEAVQSRPPANDAIGNWIIAGVIAIGCTSIYGLHRNLAEGSFIDEVNSRDLYLSQELREQIEQATKDLMRELKTNTPLKQEAQKFAIALHARDTYAGFYFDQDPDIKANVGWFNNNIYIKSSDEKKWPRSNHQITLTKVHKDIFVRVDDRGNFMMIVNRNTHDPCKNGTVSHHCFAGEENTPSGMQYIVIEGSINSTADWVYRPVLSGDGDIPFLTPYIVSNAGKKGTISKYGDPYEYNILKRFLTLHAINQEKLAETPNGKKPTRAAIKIQALAHAYNTNLCDITASRFYKNYSLDCMNCGIHRIGRDESWCQTVAEKNAEWELVNGGLVIGSSTFICTPNNTYTQDICRKELKRRSEE